MEYQDPVNKSSQLRYNVDNSLQRMEENIFQKAKSIFSNKDKNPNIEQNKDGSWVINGNPVKEVKFAYATSKEAYDLMKSYDWENGKLSWLFNAFFEAKVIKINFKEEEVEFFIGAWYDGDFYGGDLTDDISSIHGGRFMRGKYIAPNSSFNMHPTKFIDGKWIPLDEGVLGLPNVDEFKEGIHLIQIPVGQYIKISTEEGYTYNIGVVKRMDKVNSNFTYNVIFKNKNIKVPWSKIRDNFNQFYLNKGDKLFLPSLIEDDGKTISDIDIISSIDIEKDAFEGEGSQEYKIPVSYFPSFIRNDFKGFVSDEDKKKLNIKITVDSEEELNFYKRIFTDWKNAGKGKTNLEKQLKIINNGILTGVINGHNNYPHLKKIFDQQGDKIEDKKYHNALNYLDKFIGRFILNLNVSEGVKKKIIDSIKGYLGLTQRDKRDAEKKKQDQNKRKKRI